MTQPDRIYRAVAFAPATVANVAVGFDCLGFCVDVVGDTITVERTATPEVRIAGVTGLEQSLPLEAALNTATAGLLQLTKDLGLDFGFSVAIRKGIPLGSGMGGSAASAVGAIVAANAILGGSLSDAEMIRYAAMGEAAASGAAHADNVAPCLLGGLVLAQPGGLFSRIPTPEGIECVLIHPRLRVDTREARRILKAQVPLNDCVNQAANLGGFIAGCFRGDLRQIRGSLNDVLIEPQRAHLIPGFSQAKAAALAAGALGCSIAGSGPSLFAWIEGGNRAEEARSAMTRALEQAGTRSDSWIVPLPCRGARRIESRGIEQ